MADGPPEEKKDPPSEDWLVTYADAITILMAFFVMMFSIIKPTSPELLDALENSVAAGAIMSTIVGPAAAPPNPFMAMVEQMNEAAGEDGDGKVDTTSTRRGSTFEFKSGDMFAPGAAKILPSGEPTLDRVAQNLILLGIQTYKVDIEGHTDDDPISTAKFPSNWELSAARAAAVARFLISRGVDPERITVIGYGDTKPKEDNRDINGVPIPENMATNRRVVVRIER
jgi:chemotaxis protein MotB